MFLGSQAASWYAIIAGRMPRPPWNRNIHYHKIVLRSIPRSDARALDAGCGQGVLARELAQHCAEVIAIDSDRTALAQARAASAPETRITFIEGDVMTHPFPNNSFAVVAAVAMLHHLPLRPALERFRNLLKPGGVLAVIGLYREETLSDYAFTAAGFPVSRILHVLRGSTPIGAPIQDPKETLREIQSACNALLPGAVLRRHLLFRYSLVWRRP